MMTLQTKDLDIRISKTTVMEMSMPLAGNRRMSLLILLMAVTLLEITALILVLRMMMMVQVILHKHVGG